MNEVLNNIYTRRSIRRFREQAVPKDLLDEIVRAGTYAPTGKNLQLFRFFVTQSAHTIENLRAVMADALKNPAYNFYGAKTLVMVTVPKDAVNGIADASCAMENMMLAAHALGLGSCWINQLKYCGDEPEVASFLTGLGVPADHHCVGILAVGYAAEEGTLHPRKENLVTYLD